MSDEANDFKLNWDIVAPIVEEQKRMAARIHKLGARQQPLTDDQIDALQLPESGKGTIRDLVRIIEAAHGIGGSDE